MGQDFLSIQYCLQDMYGLLNSENPEELSKDLIAKSAFAEMDKVGERER